MNRIPPPQGDRAQAGGSRLSEVRARVGVLIDRIVPIAIDPEARRSRPARDGAEDKAALKMAASLSKAYFCSIRHL
jgi:hypothetical protein